MHRSASRPSPALHRPSVEDAFRTWESYLAAALRRTQERGELDAASDLAELGTGVMAALQGGLLLAHSGRSEQPVRTPWVWPSARWRSPRRLQAMWS